MTMLDSSGKSSVLNVWGGFPLQGEVTISGAKNSALVLMSAAILCSGNCTLHNVPNLTDVDNMGKILAALGIGVRRHGHSVSLNANDLTQAQTPYTLVKRLRAGFFAIGALLARLGEAHIPLPGGCDIGSRPVDLHLRGLQQMGAVIEIDQGIVHATVPTRRLHGACITLDCPSVGATETLMMAATLADGVTVINNAAREPEVVDLAQFCQSMGAHIHGAGTGRIVISGVPRLYSTEHRVMPDRIEAGSFLIAAAITGSTLTLNAVNPKDLTALLNVLSAIGVELTEHDRGLTAVARQQPTAIEVETLPYPGFPTDMQAQLMALLTLGNGTSCITETIFENRFQHVAELNRMGASIQVEGNRAVIQGVSRLVGTTVTATDLRASSALVLAGLAAEGMTTIQALHHLDRGYENLEAKFTQIGAVLERVTVGLAQEPDVINTSMYAEMGVA